MSRMNGKTTHTHKHNTLVCSSILHYTLLYDCLLYNTILYYIILYYSLLYSIILYFTILCYTLLYSIIPYYTLRFSIVCVCVFFPFILDINGRTSRGHTGGRSHRISHPPSFCGTCLNFFSREGFSHSFPSSTVKSNFMCTNDLNRSPPVGHFSFSFFNFLVRKIPFAGTELTSQRVRGLRGTSELPGRLYSIINIIIIIIITIFAHKSDLSNPWSQTQASLSIPSLHPKNK